MLVCYLDDSGKDPQSRITNIGGYIASEEQWRAFEAEVEPWFVHYEVDVLSAKELHSTDNDFRGWSVLKKQAFVSRLYQVASKYVPLGIASGAVKDAYEAGVRERASRGLRTVRPYTFCFNMLIDWILTDVRIGKAANADGVTFIIEAGHENNPEAEQQFNWIREEYKLENVLRSISFVSKTDSRAIQVADMCAFYSRRHGARLEKLSQDRRENLNPETIINIMTERLPHRTYVANSFNPDGSRFLGGS